MSKTASFSYGRPYSDKSFGVTMLGVSDELHREITGVMGNRLMTSDEYRMKKDTGAFFQGGSTGGDWIFIEFWQPQETHPEFVKYLRDIFYKHHPDGTVDGMELLPPDLTSPIKKVIVVSRHASFHHEKVINSVHEIPHQIAIDEVALKSFAEQVCQMARDKFVGQFPEFHTADWTHIILDLTPSEL